MTQSASDIAAHGNPLFYDKIAAEINTALNSKFDDQYGVCWTRTEEDLGYPEIYLNDGTKKNFRVMPDSSKSISFFTVEGELIELDERDFQVPMALIYWFDLQVYSPAKVYDYSAEILKDVYNILLAYGAYEITVNVTNPFEAFSGLAKEISENTMRPYSAAKLSFIKNTSICNA